ncbi:MAG: universal stress protein [Syntrophomonadaceae bacterium]
MIVDKVLLATDLSTMSQLVTDCVAEMAAMGVKEAVLVHVIDVRAEGSPAVASKDQQNERMLELNKIQLEARGIKVKTREPVGFPAREIVSIASQEQVSVIAIASHGEGYIKQVFLGSTATDVIRISDVPVLLIKGRESAPANRPINWNIFRRVLVPLDFSVHSDYLLQIIKDDSTLFRDVVLFSVIERARNQLELLALLYEKERQLDLIKKELEEQGTRVTVQYGQGAASLNIMEIADQENVSLILMATRGQGLIKELMLGSTAHAVARRSKQPLLLIPSRG